jgi:hypothetical protein
MEYAAKHRRWSHAILPCVLALSGCANVAQPPVSPAPATASSNPNPPANVNLSGYPLEFRQGYADGCASAHGTLQRDEGRFKSDAMYRQGYQDGKSICQAR